MEKQFKLSWCTWKEFLIWSALKRTTLNAPSSSQHFEVQGIGHRWLQNVTHIKKRVSNLLPAQNKALPLIIVVANVVYVREQRRDNHYRNDPKKYGLSKYIANWGIYIVPQEAVLSPLLFSIFTNDTPSVAPKWNLMSFVDDSIAKLPLLFSIARRGT